MVGASIFGASMVQAAETEPALEAETSLTQLPPEDKLSPELAGAIKSAEATFVSETKVEEVATKSQASEETSSKPVETKDSTVEETRATVDNASTEVASTETNVGTEPTKPGEVNGTVEKADSFTADKPASKAEIDAAKNQVAKKEYTVFPRPQKVTYSDGVTALEGKVNLVFSDGLEFIHVTVPKKFSKLVMYPILPVQKLQKGRPTFSLECVGKLLWQKKKSKIFRLVYTIKLMPMSCA